MAEWRLRLKYSHLPSCFFLWSRDKLKTLYLRFQKTYKHETWHRRDFVWGALTYHVIYPSYHATTWCHVTNKKCCILSSKRPIPSNLAEWWLRETGCNLLSHMTFFLWGHQNVTSPLPQNVWPPNFQESKFRVRCFSATKSYQLLITASSVKRNIQIKIHIFILLDLRTNTLSYHTWWRNVKLDVTISCYVRHRYIEL